jgi:uncharacterized protein Yka (UPF0111/DUF47 family)
MKAQILATIGENALGRASQVNAALAANDRIKYYLSLLQTAVSHSEHPDQPSTNLRRERLAAGVGEIEWDEVVTATHRNGDGYCRIPGCAKILESLAQDLRVMATPVIGDDGVFAQRFEHLLSRFPIPENDAIQPQTIQEITRAGTEAHDSVHQFVMDVHKRLNALQAELAEQRLDGAAVYKIDDTDRPLISAFMAGLNRTAPLKFDHPGLDATATRAGDTLIIQNDLGTTGAHVLVVHVRGGTATVTYTDVHPERSRFFRDMLRRYAVAWNQDRAGTLAEASEDADFTMLVGSYEAKNQADLEDYLAFLGSRLVFVIDWNRARKQLRGFLRGADREAVLRWAADVEVGHRAFLELGGAKVINQAIENIPGSAIHFGDRLCDVLDDEAAMKFVQFVFRAATEGLRAHDSPRLIEDRILAELQAQFASEGERLLQIAGEHAGLIFELATEVRDGVHRIASEADGFNPEDAAKRARAFEHDADQLVVTARESVRKRPEYGPLFRITEAADDTADELEQVAFLLGLLQSTKPRGEPLESIGVLASLLLEASQEWIKALGDAVHIERSGTQEDAGDFLLAIDRLMALEHQADDAERALTYASVQRARNFRQLHLYSEIGRSLEAAADALKHAGLIARDHLFASVLGA